MDELSRAGKVLYAVWGSLALLILLSLVGFVVWSNVWGPDSEPDNDRPATTRATARDARLDDPEAFRYCRTQGAAGLARELDMPADDWTELGWQYAMKIRKATSGDDAVTAANACYVGIVDAALG